MDRLVTQMLRGIYSPRIEKRMGEIGIDSPHLKDYVLDIVTGDVKYALSAGQSGLKIIAPNGERETTLSPKGASLIVNGVKGYAFSDLDNTYESDLDPMIVEEVLKEPLMKFLRINEKLVEEAFHGYGVRSMTTLNTADVIYTRGKVPNKFIENEDERHDTLIKKFNAFAVSNGFEGVKGVSPKASPHYKNLFLGEAIGKANEKMGESEEFKAMENEYNVLKTSSLPKPTIPSEEVYKDAFKRVAELIDEDFVIKTNYERERILGKSPIGPVVAVRTPHGNVIHRISSGEMKGIVGSELKGLNETGSGDAVHDFKTEYIRLVEENKTYNERMGHADFDDGASFLSSEIFFHLFEEELDRSLAKTYREIIRDVPEMKKASYMSVFNPGHKFPKAHVEETQKHVFQTRKGLMESLREYEKTGSPDNVKSVIFQISSELDNGDKKLEKKLLRRGYTPESAMNDVEKIKSEYRTHRNVKKVIDNLGEVFEGLDEHHFLSVAYVLS